MPTNLKRALDPALWVERLDERTRTARVWQHYFDARRRYCVVRMSTHCFGEQFEQVIDYRLRWGLKGWTPYASPFPVRIARKGEHLAIGGAEFELIDFGMQRHGEWTPLLKVRSDQLKITPRCAPFRIDPTWHASYLDGQIAPGVQFHASLSAKGYGKELRFARAVQTEYFSRLSDAEYFGFRYRMTGELIGWRLQTPRMYVRRRGGQADGEYRRDGEWLYVLFARRELDHLLPGDWIVDPAITQESIAANSDDCYDLSVAGTNNLNGYAGRDYVGAYGGNVQSGGLRFLTVPIPADATGMNTASLQVFRENAIGTIPTLTIYADDVDNSVTWTTGTTTNRPNGSGFARTTANTAWTTGFGSNGAYVQTPDIAAVVDEIIQRAGWANNNSMRFAIIGSGTGDNTMAYNDFSNNSTTEEALFDADYIAAGGGVTTTTLTSDASVIDEAPTWLLRNRLLDDVFTVEDSALPTIVGGGIVNTEVLTSDVALVDEILLWLIRNRLLEGTLALDDSALLSALRNRMSDSGIEVFDDLIQQVITAGGVTVAVLADGVSVIDQLLASAYRNRLQQDTTITVSEPGVQRFFFISADSALEVTDEVQYFKYIFRLLDDGIEIIDSVIAFIAGAGAVFTSSLTDAIVIVDNNLLQLLRNRMVDDTASLADELLAYAQRNRLGDDTIAVNDEGQRLAFYLRMTDDSLEISDEIIFSFLPFVSQYVIRSAVIGAHANPVIIGAQETNIVLH